MKRLPIVIATIVFLSALSGSVDAQKRKKTIRMPAVSLSQVYRDIVGTTVSDVPIEGRNGQTTTWTFDPAESREIQIIARSTIGNNSRVTIRMVTQDIGGNGTGPVSFLRGDLRLDYERIAGGWSLSQVNRGNAILTLRNPPVTSSCPVQTTPTPRVTNIVNSSFVVAPGQYKYFPFYLESTGNVSGRFRAQGGGGNDIEVLILNSDSLENYKNGHSVSTYYNSGRMTVGTISVGLAPGYYYLVFNNAYSIISNKAIEANVSIGY